VESLQELKDRFANPEKWYEWLPFVLLHRYATFEGCASRSEYWYSVLMESTTPPKPYRAIGGACESRLRVDQAESL